MSVKDSKFCPTSRIYSIHCAPGGPLPVVVRRHDASSPRGGRDENRPTGIGTSMQIRGFLPVGQLEARIECHPSVSSFVVRGQRVVTSKF